MESARGSLWYALSSPMLTIERMNRLLPDLQLKLYHDNRQNHVEYDLFGPSSYP